MSLLEDFIRHTKVKVRTQVSGKRHTTIAIGGSLEVLIEIHSVSELCTSIRFMNDQGVPYRVLGNGSNLLIPDEGITDWVITLGSGFRTLSVQQEGSFFLGGACSLMTTSRTFSDDGYSGLEFAGGIPASIGGAVWMNAGAHGGEIAERIVEVETVNSAGECEKFSAMDLPWAYRHSGIPKGSIVTGARLKLIPSEKEKTASLRAHCLAERKAHQPLTLPSSGSVFRNPSSERSAGFVIEQCNLKGTQIGGAAISSLHANWIVNPERTALSSDVQALIRLAQEKVLAQFDIDLHPELVIW